MKFKVSGGYNGAFNRLAQLRQVPDRGHRAAIAASETMKQEAVENLATQGRSTPPPLSAATKRIYKIRGNPTGKAIRMHIETRTAIAQGQLTATCGIPEGKPAVIARVQNNGATIKVTPRMRGWLAVHGIYLRASTKVIRIPARKFWTKAAKTATKQFKQDLRNILP